MYITDLDPCRPCAHCGCPTAVLAKFGRGHSVPVPLCGRRACCEALSDAAMAAA